MIEANSFGVRGTVYCKSDQASVVIDGKDKHLRGNPVAFWIAHDEMEETSFPRTRRSIMKAVSEWTNRLCTFVKRSTYVVLQIWVRMLDWI